MNKIKGMRVLVGKSQKDMAKILNMSVSTYIKKENGYISFKDSEKIAFIEFIKKYFPIVTIENIFFD